MMGMPEGLDARLMRAMVEAIKQHRLRRERQELSRGDWAALKAERLALRPSWRQQWPSPKSLRPAEALVNTGGDGNDFALFVASLLHAVGAKARPHRVPPRPPPPPPHTHTHTHTPTHPPTHTHTHPHTHKHTPRPPPGAPLDRLRARRTSAHRTGRGRAAVGACSLQRGARGRSERGPARHCLPALRRGAASTRAAEAATLRLPAATLCARGCSLVHPPPTPHPTPRTPTHPCPRTRVPAPVSPHPCPRTRVPAPVSPLRATGAPRPRAEQDGGVGAPGAAGQPMAWQGV
jgi:hypothetical protein